jgi:hypothetical protein
MPAISLRLSIFSKLKRFVLCNRLRAKGILPGIESEEQQKCLHIKIRKSPQYRLSSLGRSKDRDGLRTLATSCKCKNSHKIKTTRIDASRIWRIGPRRSKTPPEGQESLALMAQQGLEQKDKERRYALERKH